MAHPLVWPSQPTFNPLGTSSAISLTQDLSPEQPADVLMLGCGDVYNVLFTIATDTNVQPGTLLRDSRVSCLLK